MRALFVLGATLYISSLLVADETASEVLSIIGQMLIAVSTIAMISLEISTILAKVQLIKLTKITKP